MNLEDCRIRFEELEKAREELLKLLRELRILSSKAITSIHSNRISEAEDSIREASKVLEKIKIFRNFPEIYTMSHDSMQEFVEAVLLLKVIKRQFDFSIEFEVLHSAFVTGLADLIGELRRLALSKMIIGEINESERILCLMEEIYYHLMFFSSFPEKIIPNLRNKLDVARVGIERTKSDLISARLYEILDRSRRHG
ncbi:MAG: translin [Archaeoglobaceae archaeon]|nr:translin [Archaeoglobaceae archaeon]MDW7989220.1 translin [Archaeoglobaceae archaeon]